MNHIDARRELLKSRVDEYLRQVVSMSSPISLSTAREQVQRVFVREFPEFQIWAPEILDDNHLAVTVWEWSEGAHHDTVISVPTSPEWVRWERGAEKPLAN